MFFVFKTFTHCFDTANAKFFVGVASPEHSAVLVGNGGEIFFAHDLAVIAMSKLHDNPSASIMYRTFASVTS